MLQAAIDAEVEDFLAQHSNRLDERGRRLVVKNGSLPEREILTGAGAIPVTQGRVRDNTADPDKRVTFTPSVLPAYLRKTQAIEELIPWLYRLRNRTVNLLKVKVKKVMNVARESSIPTDNASTVSLCPESSPPTWLWWIRGNIRVR
ncbi:hypothetical protein Q31b_02940 [Novipirellula aureliae]|uniref:Mutator family transposase n=1 Tax=Novipirellula aureliae TaxID=2527966 RepID=A0A5C6E617_9BACT|nr:hypothetical protein [Novipirellula aureliae]TWU45123.1 hypothetical protein Q31b_02940 [Novipirellula aureliae]